MRWANKREDALPPFDKMKWLLAVAGVALHNQLIREVLEAWSLVAFGHVFLNEKSIIVTSLVLPLLQYRVAIRGLERIKNKEHGYSALY